MQLFRFIIELCTYHLFLGVARSVLASTALHDRDTQSNLSMYQNAASEALPKRHAVMLS